MFNLAGLKNTDEVILCEALIDALTFWRWGFRHVTSSYGIHGFTDELLQALVDHKIRRVLIAYDRDDAGDKAVVEVAKKLNQHGIDCFRILFPKGMDANEYALKMSPPQKSLALVIRKAEWLGAGKAPVITTVAADADMRESLPSLAAAVAESEPAPMAPPEALSIEPAPVQQLNTQATPVPALPASGVSVQPGDNELFITLGDRLYRVRGLEQNRSADQLKIQLLVKRADTFHMDKLDLYSSKQRQVFINQASVELSVQDDVLKKDLGKVLLALEEQQSQSASSKDNKMPADLEPEARKAALELLHDPALLQRILTDFSSAGVVGEETNKLTGYLACVSRKLDKPLALMIQSSSAAGKSSLMDAILALMPEEERIQYSAMTGQSLFYMGQTNLRNL